MGSVYRNDHHAYIIAYIFCKVKSVKAQFLHIGYYNYIYRRSFTLAQAKKSTGIHILGVGKYVPEMIATNEDFAKIVDTSDEWITQRTGIKTRHITNGEPMKMTVLADALFKELGTKPKYLKLPFGLAYGLAIVLEFFFKLFGSKVAPPLTRYNVCTLGRSQIFDISKAERELGYKPKITIFEMFKDYATDYLKNQQK